MRTILAVLVLALVAFPCERASAAPVFADTICPEASQYVTAMGKLRKDDPPATIYAAAQAATDAYERCSKEKLSNGVREPQHYADTRAAGFAVVASRALVSMNRLDDARAELQHWRPLVQQVVDWQSETETPHNARTPAEGSIDASARGADRRASLYRNSAKEIVAAIDAELQAIAQKAPQPKASPGA